jgi:hypothetical protein
VLLKQYYYNLHSQETTWELPVGAEHVAGVDPGADTPATDTNKQKISSKLENSRADPLASREQAQSAEKQAATSAPTGAQDKSTAKPVKPPKRKSEVHTVANAVTTASDAVAPAHGKPVPRETLDATNQAVETYLHTEPQSQPVAPASDVNTKSTSAGEDGSTIVHPTEEQAGAPHRSLNDAVLGVLQAASEESQSRKSPKAGGGSKSTVSNIFKGFLGTGSSKSGGNAASSPAKAAASPKGSGAAGGVPTGVTGAAVSAQNAVESGESATVLRRAEPAATNTVAEKPHPAADLHLDRPARAEHEQHSNTVAVAPTSPTAGGSPTDSDKHLLRPLPAAPSPVRSTALAADTAASVAPAAAVTEDDSHVGAVHSDGRGDSSAEEHPTAAGAADHPTSGEFISAEKVSPPRPPPPPPQATRSDKEGGAATEVPAEPHVAVADGTAPGGHTAPPRHPDSEHAPVPAPAHGPEPAATMKPRPPKPVKRPSATGVTVTEDSTKSTAAVAALTEGDSDAAQPAEPAATTAEQPTAPEPSVDHEDSKLAGTTEPVATSAPVASDSSAGGRARAKPPPPPPPPPYALISKPVSSEEPTAACSSTTAEGLPETEEALSTSAQPELPSQPIDSVAEALAALRGGAAKADERGDGNDDGDDHSGSVPVAPHAESAAVKDTVSQQHNDEPAAATGAEHEKPAAAVEAGSDKPNGESSTAGAAPAPPHAAKAKPPKPPKRPSVAPGDAAVQSAAAVAAAAHAEAATEEHAGSVSKNSIEVSPPLQDANASAEHTGRRSSPPPVSAPDAPSAPAADSHTAHSHAAVPPPPHPQSPPPQGPTHGPPEPHIPPSALHVVTAVSVVDDGVTCESVAADDSPAEAVELPPTPPREDTDQAWAELNALDMDTSQEEFPTPGSGVNGGSPVGEGQEGTEADAWKQLEELHIEDPHSGKSEEVKDATVDAVLPPKPASPAPPVPVSGVKAAAGAAAISKHTANPFDEDEDDDEGAGEVQEGGGAGQEEEEVLAHMRSETRPPVLSIVRPRGGDSAGGASRKAGGRAMGSWTGAQPTTSATSSTKVGGTQPQVGTAASAALPSVAAWVAADGSEGGPLTAVDVQGMPTNRAASPLGDGGRYAPPGSSLVGAGRSMGAWGSSTGRESPVAYVAPAAATRAASPNGVGGPLRFASSASSGGRSMGAWGGADSTRSASPNASSASVSAGPSAKARAMGSWSSAAAPSGKEGTYTQPPVVGTQGTTRGPSPLTGSAASGGRRISPLLAVALSKKQEALRARSPNNRTDTVVTDAYSRGESFEEGPDGYRSRSQSQSEDAPYGRDDVPVEHQMRTGTGMVRKRNPRPSQVLTEAAEGMEGEGLTIAIKK